MLQCALASNRQNALECKQCEDSTIAVLIALSLASFSRSFAIEPPVSPNSDAVDQQLKSKTKPEPVADEKTENANRESARDLSRAFRNAAARMLPSVVTMKIRSKEAQSDGVIDIVGGGDESFDGRGSGVILTAEGLILTNHHVVKDAKHIEVMLMDGRQFVAKDVKSDAESDLAICRIEANEELPVAAIGNSQDLNVGDWVLAIGCPFSLDSTVSAGIISSKNRRISEDLVSGRWLQTDAAVNPGNSGGPLIDLDGKVIGINAAISTSSGSFQGIGFAIPINRAMWVKNELLERGRVRHARMGAQLGVIPREMAKTLGMSQSRGAYVVTTTADRPADKAGMKAGDIVVEFDHQPISSHTDLAEIIAVSSIGHPLEVVILRDNKRETLQITLEARD